MAIEGIIWRRVIGFPGYSIDNLGRVRNDKTERLLTIQRNPHGVRYVGMFQNGRQRKRSIALLTAEHFVKPDDNPLHNTIIHLDGDRGNCMAENLRWRSNYFARQYHREASWEGPFSPRPIYEPPVNRRFLNTRHAAQTYGIWETDIYEAISNQRLTWFGLHKFVWDD